MVSESELFDFLQLISHILSKKVKSFKLTSFLFGFFFLLYEFALGSITLCLSVFSLALTTSVRKSLVVSLGSYQWL